MNKLVPNLRFPQFAEELEWEEKKLGEVATFTKGKGISKSDIVENGANECIRYGELYTIYGETIKEIKSRTNLDTKNLVLSELNDVIIPASGETQIDISKAACVLKKGVILGGDLNIIKTKHNGVFLSYYLNSKKKQSIAVLAQGISVVHLYASQLAILSLNFPSFAEQTQIGNFLTAVDTRISLLKQKLELLKSYKKGIMAQIFSQELRFKDENGQEFPEWEEKTLGEVVTIQGGYAFKSEKFNQGQNRVFRIGDILSTINSKNFTGVYSSEKPDNKYLVKKNDFLMALSGATFGKVGKIVDDTVGYINQRVATFRVNNYQCLEFFFQVVKSSNFKNYINSIPSTSAQPNISNTDVANFSTFIPCLAEQTKIAEFLTAIDKKINLTEQQIVQSEEWKKGLLQAMLV